MSPPDTATAAPTMAPLPTDALIIVPVRNMVLFPEIVLPITLGRPASVAAAQQAVREQRQILLVLQREADKEDPGPDDLYRIGTVANIVRYVTSPEGGHHLICQGVQRYSISEFVTGYPFLLGRGFHIPEPTTTGPEIEARFGDGEVPRPEYWGGYLVVPERIEFWQGQVGRLHDRFVYTRSGGAAWSPRRLAP